MVVLTKLTSKLIFKGKQLAVSLRAAIQPGCQPGCQPCIPKYRTHNVARNIAVYKCIHSIETKY